MLEEASRGTPTTHSPSYFLPSRLTGPPPSGTHLTALSLHKESPQGGAKSTLSEALPGAFFHLKLPFSLGLAPITNPSRSSHSSFSTVGR